MDRPVESRQAGKHRFLWILLAILVLAPLPLGSNRPVFWFSLAVVMNLLLLVRQFRPATRTVEAAGWVPGLMALLFFLLIHLIQLLPIGWLEGGALTTDRSATVSALLQWETYAVFFFLLVSELRRVRSAARVGVAIVAVAALLAAFSLLNLVFGGVLWPFSAVSYGYSAATGTYVNPNHFATLLIMAGPLAIGLLIRDLGHAWGLERHIRRRSASPIRLVTRANPFLLLAAFLILAGLMATASRGAVGAFLASGFLVALLAPRLAGSRFKMLGLLALVTVAAVLVAQLLGFGGLERKLLHPGGVLVRLELWEQSLALAKDYPLLGSGGGSYRWVFPEFKQEALGIWIFDHAHNEYLEWLVEYGVIGILPLLLFFAVVLRRGYWLVAAPRTEGRGPGMSPFLLWAVVAALLHAVVDFGLHMPANMLVLLAICAMIVNRSEYGRR